VDLILIPGYGIPIQDLPLLCREFLRQRVEPNEISALTFTEEDMCGLAERRATEQEKAEQRKKKNQHPANANPEPVGGTLLDNARSAQCVGQGNADERKW
jgi:hypothetical protein